MDVSKAIDKAAGVEREVVGTRKGGTNNANGTPGAYNFRGRDIVNGSNNMTDEVNITAPATPEAAQWEGWGTALKPAHEPIIVCRKPLSEGTVAANVLRWGVGGINIDGCRVETTDTLSIGSNNRTAAAVNFGMANDKGAQGQHDLGRFPANLIHDGSDEVLAGFPDSAGQQGDLKETGRNRPSSGRYGDMAPPLPHLARIETDKSAARFFYCAKASKSDRGEFNNHPTVKPQALMRYLCRLVTPPGGTVLDSFAGSGSTAVACEAEGFKSVSVEQCPDNFNTCCTRVFIAGVTPC